MVRLRARSSRDDGFTLVEVILSMVIMAIVMTALAAVVVGSLTTIAQARQRQTATALATQQLERMRAQPYDKITHDDPAFAAVNADYAASTAGVTTFTPPAKLLTGVSETMVINEISGKAFDQQVDRITYRVQTYVTKPALTASGSQVFNLTVIVKWTSAVSDGVREIVQRSTTFSSAGCLSTATSPFAAPCQAYYTVRAGESLSGLTVSSTLGPDQDITGMDASQLQLDFAHTASSLLVEQTATGTASAVTSSASVSKSTTTGTGGEAAGAAVDSDPSSVPNQSVTSTTSGKTSATLSASGAGGTLRVRPSTSDAGAARAAIAAPTAICASENGAGLLTGAAGIERPCASSDLQVAGSGATLDYESPGGTGIRLATFNTGGAPSRAVAAVLGSSNAGICSASTIVDCGHAGARRAMGGSSFAAAAFTSAPSSFSSSFGLFSVSGIAEAISAEEGKGALAPAFSRIGTVRVWNGTGYDSIDLSAFSTPAGGATPVSQTWVIPPTDVSYAGGITVNYEGSVTVQRPRIVRAPAVRTGNVVTDCKAQACTTTVDASGSVTASVTVVVSDGGTEITRFAIAANLGGLTADSAFKAAANA